jgi:ribonuclease P protein component
MKRYSFPKEKRLTRSGEFDQVKNQGQTHRGKLLIVGVLAGKQPSGFRAGFITPRGIGVAAVRNRVRRRLREIVRKHQHEVQDEAWIVVIARPSAARAGYGELEDEWLRLAKRASILAL